MPTDGTPDLFVHQVCVTVPLYTIGTAAYRTTDKLMSPVFSALERQDLSALPLVIVVLSPLSCEHGFNK